MSSHSGKDASIISPDDVIIPIMGMTGSGKSTFIARCTGDNSGIGHGLESRTQEVSFGMLYYRGRRIILVDTPGFDDSNTKHDDSYILREISSWLVVAYSQDPPLLLSGVIYLHPINEVRMRGSAKSNLRMFKAMCGPEPLSCVVLATTMWANVSEHTGWQRQDEIAETYWSDMTGAGSVVLKHDDTKESALQIIDHIMSRKKQMPLIIQQQLVQGKMTVAETSAGQELESKVNEELARTEKKLQRTRTELMKALAEKDSASASEILDQQRKFEAEIQAKDAELRSMQVKAEELRKKKMEEMEKTEAERQRLDKEREERLAEMKKSLEVVQLEQERLKVAGTPPSYELARLDNHNEMLQMKIKRLETQQQIEKFEEQQRLSIQQSEQANMMAAQRHAEQLKNGRRQLGVAVVGAAAGIAALNCTIM